MRSRSFPLALAASAALLAVSATATPYRVHFTGTVTFDDTRDLDTGVHYEPSLVGAPWTGSYSYDESGLLLDLDFTIGDLVSVSIDEAYVEYLAESGDLNDYSEDEERSAGPTHASLSTVNFVTLAPVKGDYFSGFFLEGGQLRLYDEIRATFYYPEYPSNLMVGSLESLSIPVVIPEPSTLVLIGLGLLLGVAQRRISAASQ